MADVPGAPCCSRGLLGRAQRYHHAHPAPVQIVVVCHADVLKAPRVTRRQPSPSASPALSTADAKSPPIANPRAVVVGDAASGHHEQSAQGGASAAAAAQRARWRRAVTSAARERKSMLALLQGALAPPEAVAYLPAVDADGRMAPHLRTVSGSRVRLYRSQTSLVLPLLRAGPLRVPADHDGLQERR